MTKETQRKPAGGRRRKQKVAENTSVTRELQMKIGAQLRAMHDDIIREGVPDRFRELLNRLDQSKSKG